MRSISDVMYSLMTRNSDNITEIELHAPAIRHDLLLLFSEQQGQELKKPKGKETTAQRSIEGDPR